jgi:Cu+-exporting ATPase
VLAAAPGMSDDIRHDVATMDRTLTPVYVAVDGVIVAVAGLGDRIRDDALASLNTLRSAGWRTIMLSGDAPDVVAAVGGTLGFAPADAIGSASPEDKLAFVEQLKRSGRVVMVGDGVNDAAALAQADLGIAMGSGTDVAIEASDLTLVRADLQAAADAIQLSRRTLGIIKGNLFWAFAYNVAAIPLAALGLLNPVIAGLAMAASSVFVVTNSLRLRSFRAA